MSAILGVDLGKARIGVAISAGARLPAVPLTTISHTSRARDVAALTALAREREVTVIVVGYPLRLDGTRGPAAQDAERFIAALRESFGGEVVAHDERLTTALATRKLQGLNLSGSKRRERIDQAAAVEILNSYLARPQGR